MINFNGTSFSAAQTSNNLVNFNGASMCTVVNANTGGICYDCQCLYLSQSSGWCCVAPRIVCLPVYLWCGQYNMCMNRVCKSVAGCIYVQYDPVANRYAMNYASVCLLHTYPSEVGNKVCAQVTNVGNCYNACVASTVCFPTVCGTSSVTFHACYSASRAGTTVTTDAFGTAQVKCKGVSPTASIPSHRRKAAALNFKCYELGVPFCQGNWIYVYTTACNCCCFNLNFFCWWCYGVNCVCCCVSNDFTTCLDAPVIVSHSPEMSNVACQCVAYAAWYAATYCCCNCLYTSCSDIWTSTTNCSSRTVCLIRPGVCCNYSLSGLPVWRNVSV